MSTEEVKGERQQEWLSGELEPEESAGANCPSGERFMGGRG